MKRALLVIPFIITLVALFIYFNFISSNKYEKVDLTKYNTEAKSHMSGKTEADLLKNLTYFIGSEGEFQGTIKQYRSGDKLIIDVHEEYIPDDSINSIDERFIAEKRNGVFKVIEYLEKTSY